MDEKYFIAKIAVETVDNDSGKVKIKREETLFCCLILSSSRNPLESH